MSTRARHQPWFHEPDRYAKKCEEWDNNQQQLQARFKDGTMRIISRPPSPSSPTSFGPAS